ncbi:MAG: HU family DNA-binding protein [Candidatus Aminicenantes bacterium]|nr:HU family DNA-binding protein [Candidatus Aminicenantes bacterium]
MASIIRAIAEFAPKIKNVKTSTMSELVKTIAGRTGLNKGDILQVVNQFKEVIILTTQAGRGVKIEGLATFKPKINLKGQISLSIRIDPSFIAELNAPKTFEGFIENREMIGKTTQDIITKWNEKYPDDPVV